MIHLVLVRNIKKADIQSETEYYRRKDLIVNSYSDSKIKKNLD